MLVFRQVLATGVRWKLLGSNPARDAGPNPEPPRRDVQPFESLAEIDALAVELGPWSSFAVLGSETGLRPEELLALERRDVDRGAGVLLVQRAFAKGRLKEHMKTSRSRRRVPLTTRATEALGTVPARLDTALVFPSRAGGYVDLNNFRRREWAPAIDAAGLPSRTIYALRHTYASWALDAGISIFELARFMGTSVKMIDRTYGHLVRGSEDRAREKLEARARREAEEAGVGWGETPGA